MHVWVSGFEAKPDDIDLIARRVLEKYPEVIMQFVDLDKVPGSRFLFLATFNALKSFRSKQPISKKLNMEILLYISANRQIAEAIRLVGINAGTRNIAVVLVGQSEEALLGASDTLNQIFKQPNNDALVDLWSTQRTENVRTLFRIIPKELKATRRENESEIEAMERLAIERSAILTVRK